MKCLKRNESTFYYYLYDGKSPILDGAGNRTGEYILEYRAPVKCEGNISAGNGDAQVELFGTGVTYNRVIVLDDANIPITETTLLCIDVPPQAYVPGEVPNHDYTVKAVAHSLNSVAIAISKVDTNENKG